MLAAATRLVDSPSVPSPSPQAQEVRTVPNDNSNGIDGSAYRIETTTGERIAQFLDDDGAVGGPIRFLHRNQWHHHLGVVSIAVTYLAKINVMEPYAASDQQRGASRQSTRYRTTNSLRWKLCRFNGDCG